jgi:hypothetical protein
MFTFVGLSKKAAEAPMASQLPSLAASAGLCLLSVLAAALLAVTLYILAVVASFAVFCAREFARRDRDRPPLVGTVFRQLNNFHRLFDEHVSYALSHPTSRLVYPGHSEFYTADPAVIEHVLKTSFSKYSKVALHAHPSLFPSYFSHPLAPCRINTCYILICRKLKSCKIGSHHHKSPGRLFRTTLIFIQQAQVTYQ